MPKFVVEAQEVVFYEFTVEAESLEEARKLIAQGEFDSGEPIDGEDFEVINVEPITMGSDMDDLDDGDDSITYLN